MSKKILTGSIHRNPTTLQKGSVTDQIEDRSAYLRSQDISWDGSSLTFADDIVLEIINTSDGTITQHTIQASESPVALANGESIYATIDRTQASENLILVNSGSTPIPSHSDSNKDIFVLFRRVNVTGDSLLVIPLHKQVIETGQTLRIGVGGTVATDTVSTVSLTNNQTSPANISGFSVDPDVHRSFKADVEITRHYEDTTEEDNDFYSNLGSAFSGGGVFFVGSQDDGKLLIGGGFTSLNGNTRNRLVRINYNGTEDNDFYTNLGTGFNSGISVVRVQPDGKILVGGSFTTLDGNTRNRLVRLNSDGTEDTGFYTNLGTGFDGIVNAIEVQDDGDILVGGFFTDLNTNTRNYLVRLNSDGTEDSAFYTNLGTGFGNAVLSLAVQSDDDILVGGSFTTLDGNTRNRLVRLNSDGTEDTGFYTNLGTGFDSAVQAIKIQDDGDIVVGGFFTDLNTNTRNYLVRLNSDGTEDSAFYTNLGTGFGHTVRTVYIQQNGDIIVGGDFTTLDGNTRNYLVRLNSDGTEDSAFYTAIGAGFGASVYSTIVNPLSASIVAGGTFTTFDGNTRNNLVQISTDIELVNQFDLRGVYKTFTKTWQIGAEFGIGDETGIDLTMNSSGQLQYTSTNISGTEVTSEISFKLLRL